PGCFFESRATRETKLQSRQYLAQECRFAFPKAFAGCHKSFRRTAQWFFFPHPIKCPFVRKRVPRNHRLKKILDAIVCCLQGLFLRYPEQYGWLSHFHLNKFEKRPRWSF